MREETIRISQEELQRQRDFARQVRCHPDRPKSYYIVTYGCQMNAHDSEKLAGMLEEMGLEPAAERTAADFVLHNTCCIRDNAERKALGNVTWLKEVKKERPDMLIGVCGCMIQQQEMAQKLLKQYPFIDVAFGTGNLYRLPEYLWQAVSNHERVIRVENEASTLAEGLPIHRESDIKAYITVMYGCNNFCSYCIVPYVRGRERSRRADDIVREADELVKSGVKEIMLIGQNVNSYGLDSDEGVSFAQLLHRVSQTGIERIRFMTSHPKDFNQSVAEVIEKYPSLCHNIHLPVQSGSNSVLKRMNRRYTREQYLELVRTIRTHLPDVGLTTDVMVGFAGETEEDFNDTLSLMEEVRFSSAFCFVYSRRKGTPGYSMENQVSREVKTERIKKLIALQNRITKEISKEHEGKVFEILVEDKNEKFENTYCGRTDGGRLVNLKSPTDIVGQFVHVKIKTSRSATLWGDLITEEK